MTTTGKIFCIGLSGTGTKSVVLALRQMGYSAIHLPKSIDQIATYDAAADISVTCRYKELDQLFPGSKFILTTREKKGWLDSRSRKPLKTKLPKYWILECRLRMYGRLAFDPVEYDKFYDDFLEDVTTYFTDRPDDLLTIDVSKPGAFDAFASFLGKSGTTLTDFPFIRKARGNNVWMWSEYRQRLSHLLQTGLTGKKSLAPPPNQQF